MRHELLTQHALFSIGVNAKWHAESAFRDACHTSSGLYSMWEDGRFRCERADG